MILYTMMPQELVYPVTEQEYSNQMMISYNGVPLLVEKTEDAEYRIIRVVSSDPNHFLTDGIAPGTKIPLHSF